jgi:hypothetical protein
MSFPQQIRDKGRTGSAWKLVGEEGRGWGKGEGGEMTQTMYSHVNK